MVEEAQKSLIRRGFDRRYAARRFVGAGIDISNSDNALEQYWNFFPQISSVQTFVSLECSATFLNGLSSARFDFIHSSHRLEHSEDPEATLNDWIQACRPGGHIIFTVPDEDLYEQGVFPSTFDSDHKWTFSITKKTSWSPKSVNLFELIEKFSDKVEVLKLELLDSGFEYNQTRYDQTLALLSESAIEVVLRRRVISGRFTSRSVFNAFQPVNFSRKALPLKVLVKRTMAMGDVIMMIPALRRLRFQLGPDAVIDVETRYPSVLEDCPFINKNSDLREISLNRDEYDEEIDLDGVYELSPRLHVIDAYFLRAFGDAEWPDKKSYISRRRSKYFEKMNLSRCIAIHPARTQECRTLPLSFWNEFIDLLISHGFQPIILGSHADWSWPDDERLLNFTAVLTIQEVAYIISKSDCFVGVDSGLLHVAGSTETPIVGLFTNSLPDYRMPWRNGSVFWKAIGLLPDLSCVGCLQNELPPATFFGCRRGDFACINSAAIKPLNVLSAIYQLIGNSDAVIDNT